MWDVHTTSHNKSADHATDGENKINRYFILPDHSRAHNNYVAIIIVNWVII